ncbi:MAG TPA: HD domain-containing protein, partial [Firmicutes bacterium]|nr:HD domain-containing protein [Bacillota bacterium]
CRFFPELSKVRFLVRHDFYHRYTVDEHSIRAVELLEKLSARRSRAEPPEQFSEDALAGLARRCARPEVLRLATLFHDAGKGYGKGHSERGAELVAPVLERLGIPEQEQALVRFLIQNHLLHSETAFRRDLDDLKTVEEFTARVGSLERLEPLLVLTYVDIASASPGSMTPWKAELLWQLYLRSRRQLLGQPSQTTQDVEKSRQHILTLLAANYPKALILDQLEQLPSQYTLFSSPGLIGRHLAALQRYDGKRTQVNIRFLDLHEMELTDDNPPEREAIEVVICTQDRLGLFRDIARGFHLENFHIRGARLFTRKDGTVIDTITAVNALPESPVGAVRQQLLAERLERLVAPGTSPSGYEIHPLPERRELSDVDLDRSSFRTRIDLLNDVSDDYSLLEIGAIDHPALLETLAACLTAKGIDIRFARLQTQGSRAVLAFYVTDSRGGKITDTDRQAEIRRFILRHLDPKARVKEVGSP